MLFGGIKIWRAAPYAGQITPLVELGDQEVSLSLLKNGTDD